MINLFKFCSIIYNDNHGREKKLHAAIDSRLDKVF